MVSVNYLYASTLLVSWIFHDSFRVTEKLLHQWSDYDQLFETLSQWLKDTEVKVTGATEVKATLEEKRGLCDKYRVSTVNM